MKMISLALLAAGFASCEGQGGDEGPAGNGKLTLTADRQEIEADGKETAVLTLTDADGKVLTEGSTLRYVTFEEVNTGMSLERRSNTFSSIKNGTFTFKAKYKGREAENTVTVTAKNRVKYEKYFHKVVAYDVTNTQCGPCGYLAGVFENVPAEWKEHLAVMAVHGNFDNRDPWIIGNVGTVLMSSYGGTGFPFCLFNLDYAQKGVSPDTTPSAIADIIEKQMRKSPATCGIAVESSLAGNSVTVKTRFTSSTGGEYDLGYAVLLDNQKFVGGTVEGGIYNDIVASISGNYCRMSSDKFTAEKDREISGTYSFDDEEVAKKSKDCRVVVFALRDNGEKVIIDNAAVCGLGESVDYILNE